MPSGRWADCQGSCRLADFTGMPVKNQPPFKFTVSTFESKATQGAKEHTGMEGQNNGGFENRATQESGTH